MSAIIDDKIVAGAKISTDVKEDPLIALTERVKSLYRFRDHYFETHGITSAIDKSKDVEKEMKETVAKFDECKGYEIDGARARYYYLKGRALNVVDRYIPQAEELLSKAVKLEPKLIEAWNELGECYWKNNDIKQAKNCFAGALPHGRNKTSLRNLSMVMRQEQTDSNEQRVKNVQTGVEFAKEAVSLDTSDGISWTILGNAYLSSFFALPRNPATLRLCMTAYAQAEKDVVASSDPYLFLNKASALKYQEEYKSCLNALERAALLDPTWELPRTKRDELLKYVKDVQSSINHKGRMKPKRLHQLVQSLDEKHLGPYKSGTFGSANSYVKLKLTTLNELNSGINLEKLVFGKVICWIQDSESVPFSFCIIDREKTCMAVTVYNLAEGRGVSVGDSVAIPEPYLTHHTFAYGDNDFDFKSIRVETPMVLVLNGRKLGRDYQAGVKLCSYNKPD